MNIKKFVSGVMATFLSLGLAAGTALAAGSATALPSVVNNSAYSDQYTVNEVTSVASFSTIQAQTPQVASAIVATNNASSSSSVTETLLSELEDLVNDSSLPESVKTSSQNVLDQIQANDLAAITNFFDVDKTGDNVEKTADGKYLVTLTIPSLTTNTTDVTVLHYSIQNQEWELITPTVDLANKQIVVEFDTLSPVMVLAKAGTGSGLSNMTNATTTTTTSSSTSSTTSPKTSVDSDWGMYATVAVVLAAAGVAVLAVRRKSASRA